MSRSKMISCLMESLIFGLLSLILATSSAQADSAVAEDSAGNLSAYSSSSINQAAAAAMAACFNRGVGGCVLHSAPNSRGWAAIAKGGDRVHWVYGRATRSAAIQSVLNECSAPDSCEIMLIYLDDSQ